jgi:flagellar motility protein MotE (MotC chaperone)
VVFEQLDMEVQMKVAQRMRERSTAMIMAAMTPKGAAALSMALARKSARLAAVAPPPQGGQRARK